MATAHGHPRRHLELCQVAARRMDAADYALLTQIVRRRGKVDAAVVAMAMNSGLSAATILDIVAECSFASLVGTIGIWWDAASSISSSKRAWSQRLKAALQRGPDQ